MVDALKALIAGILTDEPVLVSSVIVAAITAVLGLVGLTLSPLVVVGVAAFVVAQLGLAFHVRSKVTPV